MRSTRFLPALKSLNARGRASPGERVISSLFPGAYGYPSANWAGQHAEEITHFRGWVFSVIDLIAGKVASVTPNLAYVTHQAKPGHTVKACQRGLMNLMGRGFGGAPWVGGRYERPVGLSAEKGHVEGEYVGVDWRPNQELVARGGHSFLTLGEWQSKALSVIKPHEELEPLEADHHLRSLIDNPNPLDTYFDVEYELSMFEELCGVSYEWIPPSITGKPAERWCIPSHWVWPILGGGPYSGHGSEYDGRLIKHFMVRPWGGYGSAGSLEIDPSEIIMTRCKSPLSKIDGWGKLAAGAQWIDTDESIVASQWAQVQNVARPELLIELGPGYEDPNDDRIARIEAKMNAKMQGEYNYGKPLIAPPGAKVTTLSFSPTDMAYDSSSDRSRDRVCALWKVSKTSLGLSDSLTYGSLLASLATTCEECINPRLIKRGQTRTKFLASRWDEDDAPHNRSTSYAHGPGRSGGRKVKLWYDNCVPADPQQVNADLAEDRACILPGQELQGRVIGASEAGYAGEAVEIRTRSGLVVFVTPNHPVLTMEGFVPAGLLEEGQNLLRYVRGERLPTEDDVENASTIVEKVFDALCRAYDFSRGEVTAAPVDFHGDAKFFKGKIRVVGSYGKLRPGVVAEDAHGVGEDGFVGFGLGEIPSCGSGVRGLGSVRDFLTPHADGHISPVRFREFATAQSGSDAGAVDLPSAFGTQPFPPLLADGLPVASSGFHRGSVLGTVPQQASRLREGAEFDSGLPELFPQPTVSDLGVGGDFLDGFAGSVSSSHLRHVGRGFGGKPLCFGPAAELNVPRSKGDGHGMAADAVLASELVDRFPGKVATDEIVEIRKFHYDGPVYDFESPFGYILVNGVCVSNSYAITPNEVRALRGRKPYRFGGDDPWAQSPAGVVPFPVNTQEDLTELAELIQPMVQSQEPVKESVKPGEGGSTDSPLSVDQPEAPDTKDVPPKIGIAEPNGKPQKTLKVLAREFLRLKGATT